MRENRLYSEFAHLWTLISAPEDYAEEAAIWRHVLRKHLGRGRHRILELGVGGGNNLSHLAGEFEAVAVDVSPEMLAQCRALNPGVELHQGDMRSVRLGRTFDAVLIHDAISYMRTESQLRDAFKTAAAHLEHGGLFITAPDYVTETFEDGYVRYDQSEGEGIELTHIEYQYDPDPFDTQYKSLMIYIIREGGRVRVERDLHILGLYPKQRWLILLDECGFKAGVRDYPVAEDKRQQYLFVSVKR